MFNSQYLFIHIEHNNRLNIDKIKNFVIKA